MMSIPEGAPRPKPDLAWAAQHIKGFAKCKAQIDAKTEDEQRYKRNPGYVPHERPQQ